MSNLNDFIIENGVLIKYKGKDENVVIPEGVTAIGEGAFQKKSKIKNLLIPEGVQLVGTQAFAECTGLECIDLPESVKKIGCNAFADCINLKHVKAPLDVLVENCVCPNCRQLADNDGFVVIGSTLCSYFGTGGALVIPQGVTRIAGSLFYSVFIRNEGSRVAVSDLSISKEITSIVIPEGVSCLDAYVFASCENLTEAVLPQSLVRIGESAFSRCKQLSNIVIPEMVTRIEEGTFFGCESLTAITLPKNVGYIGPKAFQYCKNLKTVTILSTECKIANTMFDYKIVPVHFYDISALPADIRPCAAVGFAEADGPRDDPRYESHIKYIKANVAKLVDLAMEYPSLLTLMCREKLITAKNIEKYVEAAQNSQNAELITMVLDYQTNKLTGKQKESVAKKKEKQEDTVFERAVARQQKRGIDGLNFVVTGNVETFKNRNELKTFIEEKGGKLMAAMSAKTDYLIMNDADSDTEKKKKAEELGIEIIAERQFNEKADRQYLVDQDGVLIKYLGCKANVVIPDDVTAIGRFAFKGCIGLMSVTIPASVISIGASAFFYCTGLMSVTIPDSVTTIGWDAFSGCTGLTSVSIPDSVTSIGKYAFSDCTGLTIHALAGSYAETYAKENNIPFVAE